MAKLLEQANSSAGNTTYCLCLIKKVDGLNNFGDLSGLGAEAFVICHDLLSEPERI